MNQPAVWERFFEFGLPGQYSVYCHPKSPETIQTELLRRGVISPRIATELGGISLVRATLLLLHEAYSEGSNEFFALCSESCVPIWDFPTFHKLLSKDQRSRIHIFNNFEPKRWGLLRDKEFLPRERFLKQHQWMILNREAAGLVLQHDFTEVFEDMYASDEHYFISVLAKIGYPLEQKCSNQMTTWVNWNEPEARRTYELSEGVMKERTWLHPKKYSEVTFADINTAREQRCLFFRKVSAECPNNLMLRAVSPQIAVKN